MAVWGNKPNWNRLPLNVACMIILAFFCLEENKHAKLIWYGQSDPESQRSVAWGLARLLLLAWPQSRHINVCQAFTGEQHYNTMEAMRSSNGTLINDTHRGLIREPPLYISPGENEPGLFTDSLIAIVHILSRRGGQQRTPS